MSKLLFRSGPALLSCCTALSLAAAAGAQEPSCDLDCIKGYSCAIQPPEGCPESAEASCDLTPSPICVPDECGSDADCAEHAKCYDDDASDGDDAPPLCLPRYVAGCNTAEDCGAGFDCLPYNPCLDPAEPDCVPSGDPICFVTEMRPCQADSDCLPDWTCENNPRNGFSISPSGNYCSIVDPPLICFPPHSNLPGHGLYFIDFYTGVEFTRTLVPESECPSRQPDAEPRVPYATSRILQGASERAGSSKLGPAVSNDDLRPSASADGCSIAIAADPNTNHTSKALGFASVLGLLGWMSARRRTPAARQS